MQRIKEIIKCSICADTFCDPKVLPCVHTFCLKCLETLRDKVEQPECNKLSCPVCRNDCLIPGGGLSCLPNNYFLQQLIEIDNITAISSKTLRCESCDRDEGSGEENESVSEASVYCLDCQQSFCAQCHKAHDKMRLNKSHKVIEPGNLNVKRDGLMKMTLSFCDRHQDEPVKHYCLDCQIIICLSCYVEEHSTHKCSSIGKEAEQARLQLQEDVAGVQEQSEKLLTVSKEIEVEKKTLLDEIESIKQFKMKELEAAKELNERHQLMMDSFTRYVKEVINQATDAELLRCASAMKIRAADLKSIHTPSDFLAVKIGFKIRNAVVGDIQSISRNTSNPLLLHNDTLQVMEKIQISPFQLMTSFGNELYTLSPTDKTNLDFGQRGFYIVLAPEMLPYFPHPQQNQGIKYTHLLVYVLPVYYENSERFFLKFTFSNIQPYAHQLGTQLEATFSIAENTINLLCNETVEDTQAIDIQATTNTTKLTLDVKITYKTSSITLTASNVRLSTNTAALRSVQIIKEIGGIYSMLQLNVYNSLTYSLQRQMNLYIVTRTHVDVSDMTSCSFYNCIYIGDKANRVIYRFEELGSSSRLKLKDAPRGLSVTKQHTLLVACSTNKLVLLSTDGTMIREISLSGLINPRRVIYLEGEQYLITGDLRNTDNFGRVIPATHNFSAQAFLVDATGRGKQLEAVPIPEVTDMAVDQHGCLLILTKNNTLQIRKGPTQATSEMREIALSDHSLFGCDQMHFDRMHGRLYLSQSNTPGVTVIVTP